MRFLCCLLTCVAAICLRFPITSQVIAQNNTDRPTFSIDTESGYIGVSVSISDKTYSGILDTGTTMSLVDSQLQPRLGRKIADRHLRSGNVRVQSEIFECPDLRLGSLTLPFANSKRTGIVGLCDFQAHRDTLHENVFIVVGMAHMSRAIMELTFDGKSLRFLKREDAIRGERIRLGATPEAIPTVIPKLGGLAPMVGISVNSPKMGTEKDVPFVIDTGYSECLGINGKLFGELVQRDEIRLAGSYIGGNFQGTMGVMRLGRLRRLGIGELTLDNVTVVNLGDVDLNVIGLKCLTHFCVTFDFPRAEMYLAPGKRMNQPDLTGIQGFGACFSSKGIVELGSDNLTVVSIDLDGPAAKAGLKVGDVIERIDGKGFKDKSLFQINRSFEKSGQDLTLRIRRGEETRDITIAIPKEPPGMFALDGSTATNKKVK